MSRQVRNIVEAPFKVRFGDSVKPGFDHYDDPMLGVKIGGLVMTAIPFIACAAASLLPLRAFFNLRKSLSSAQRVDVEITTTKGLFASLPIYKYMRVHMCLALVVTSVIFLISALAVIMTSYSLEVTVLPFLNAIWSLLTLLLAVHTALLAIYESTKPSDRMSGQIRQILQTFRERLWSCALSLFASVILLILCGLVYSVLQATWQSQAT